MLDYSNFGFGNSRTVQIVMLVLAVRESTVFSSSDKENDGDARNHRKEI